MRKSTFINRKKMVRLYIKKISALLLSNGYTVRWDNGPQYREDEWGSKENFNDNVKWCYPMINIMKTGNNNIYPANETYAKSILKKIKDLKVELADGYSNVVAGDKEAIYLGNRNLKVVIFDADEYQTGVATNIFVTDKV